MTNPANFSTANTRTNYTPADYRTSYVQSWHFTIQRELGNDLVLDVAYVGNRGNGLMILGDYNQARPNNPGENVALAQRRPIQGFDFIQISFGGGFSTYHALQWKIEKRYARGFYLLNSFTWSKAIDNAAGHLEAFNNDNSRVNYRDLPNEKGLGSYNQPVNNTTTVVWDVPYGKGRRWGSSVNPFVQAVIGGWRLTGINTMTAGQPVNISYGPPAAFSVSGTPTHAAQLCGRQFVLRRIAVRTPTSIRAAVIAPSTATPNDPSRPFGNLGRNVASDQWNLQPGSGRSQRFRAAVGRHARRVPLGILQPVQQDEPRRSFGECACADNYGTITSLASPARQIQFALKIVF